MKSASHKSRFHSYLLLIGFLTVPWIFTLIYYHRKQPIIRSRTHPGENVIHLDAVINTLVNLKPEHKVKH
jgi:hypothetical protein